VSATELPQVSIFQVRDYLDLHTPAELNARAVALLRAMVDHAVYKGDDYGKVIFRAAVYEAAGMKERSVIQALTFVTRASEEITARALKALTAAGFIVRNWRGRKSHRADILSVLPLLALVAEFYSAGSGLAHLPFRDRQNVVYAAALVMPRSQKSCCMPTRRLS
jgi:hypothetical protein